jgi:hypothetical protein
MGEKKSPTISYHDVMLRRMFDQAAELRGRIARLIDADPENPALKAAYAHACRLYQSLFDALDD